MKGILIPDSEMHTALIIDAALRDPVVDGVSLGEWLRRLVGNDPASDHAGVHQAAAFTPTSLEVPVRGARAPS